MRAAVAETEAQERVDNAATQKQLEKMNPAWTSYINNFQDKFRIGALSYMDYGLYTQPASDLSSSRISNPPGPYNNRYNSFDITRVYLNTYYTPTDNWLFRFTPEIYRANGTADGRQDRCQQRLCIKSRRRSQCAPEVRLRSVQRPARRCSLAQGWQYHFWRATQPLYSLGRRSLPVPFRQPGAVELHQLSSSQTGLQFDGPINRSAVKRPIGLRRRRLRQGNFHNQNQTESRR